MKPGDEVEVHLDDPDLPDLFVTLEEFYPYEPAMYVHEAGWMASNGNREFYLGESGRVEENFPDPETDRPRWKDIGTHQLNEQGQD